LTLLRCSTGAPVSKLLYEFSKLKLLRCTTCNSNSNRPGLAAQDIHKLVGRAILPVIYSIRKNEALPSRRVLRTAHRRPTNQHKANTRVGSEPLDQLLRDRRTLEASCLDGLARIRQWLRRKPGEERV